MSDFQVVSIEKITPSNVQPRLPGKVDDLTQSIQEGGTVHQPLIVYPNEAGNGYIIWMGERRWRSAREAGLRELPVVIKPRPDFLTFLAGAVTENESRRELEPMELAWALEIYHLLANILALAKKYEALRYLQSIEDDIRGISSTGDDLIDEMDRQVTRQQEVLFYLRGVLTDALTAIDKTKEDWRPLVSWDTCVQRIGLSLSPRRRRQILELLNLAEDVQAAIVGSGISEHAARGLAKQPVDEQRRIVQEAKDGSKGLAALTHKAAAPLVEDGLGEDDPDAETFESGDSHSASAPTSQRPAQAEASHTPSAVTAAPLVEDGLGEDDPDAVEPFEGGDSHSASAPTSQQPVQAAASHTPLAAVTAVVEDAPDYDGLMACLLRAVEIAEQLADLLDEGEKARLVEPVDRLQYLLI